MGKFWGSVATVCLMGSFISTALVYNYVFARLLMTAAIDKRLPVSMGRLNANRVPANAIIFQTTVAIIYTLLAFVLAPSFGIGDPAIFPVQIYNVSQAAAVLVWAISASFLFIDLIGCYRRYRDAFRRWLFLPMPLLWLCIFVGILFCIGAILDTLVFSWTPAIGNNYWWLFVGGLSGLFLIGAIVGSIVATSEAAWENMREG